MTFGKWLLWVDEIIGEIELRSQSTGNVRPYHIVRVCPLCNELVDIALQDGVVWLHTGLDVGINPLDPVVALLAERIKRLHPDWIVHSACKICHDELDFLKSHSCVGKEATVYSP